MKLSQVLLEYVMVSPEKLALRAKQDNTFSKFENEIGDDFAAWLEQHDPTQKKKYVNWMINRYMKGDIKRLEDIPSRISNALDTFDKLARTKKLKPEHKDINRIKDIESVIDEYKSTSDDELQSNKEKRKSLEQSMYDNGDAKLLFNSDEYKIVIPKTEKGSCFFGKNTRWCTAADNNNMFDHYASDGDMYIILHKPTNRRWQFHFESNQFMDEQDDEIELKEFLEEHLPVFKVLGKTAAEQVSESYATLGPVIFDSNNNFYDFEDLAEADPAAGKAYIRKVLSEHTTSDVDGTIVEANGSEYVLLERYSDLWQLARDMTQETYDMSQTPLVQALEYMSENLEPDISVDDSSDFIELFNNADSDFLESIRSAIEKAGVTMEDIEEIIGGKYDDYESLDEEVMAELCWEMSDLDSIKEDLMSSALEVMSDGYVEDVEDAIKNAFDNYNMEWLLGTVLFYADGEWSTGHDDGEFFENTQCALGVQTSVMRDLIEEQSHTHVYSNGWSTDLSSEYFTVDMEDISSRIDSDNADDIIEHYKQNSFNYEEE